MMTKVSRFLTVLIFSLLLVRPSLAQTDADVAAEKSWVLTFIEQNLSTPNRQIRFENIEGALSSQAVIGRITIADRQGVWLQIHDAQIDWDRLEMLRGRITINKLAARRIDWLRRPIRDDKKSFFLEARPFTIPQLPLAVVVGRITTDQLILGGDVAGAAATASIEGSFRFEDGALQTHLLLKRLDAGGALTLTADYLGQEGTIKINLDLAEPEDGLLAHLLELEGRPALNASIKGEGTLDLLDVDLQLATAHNSILSGVVALRQKEDGRHVKAQMSGSIATLMPPKYRPFFDSKLDMNAEAMLLEAGGWRLDRFEFDGGGVSMQAKAASAQDDFLRYLLLDAKLEQPQGARWAGVIDEEETRISRAALQIAYGLPGQTTWTGQLTIENLVRDEWSAKNIILDMGGVAENLDDPQKRHISLLLQGKIDQLQGKDQLLVHAMGETPILAAEMSWRKGDALKITQAHILGQNFSSEVQGEIDDFLFNGLIKVTMKGEEKNPLADLRLKGNFVLTTGAFDFDLQGHSHGFQSGMVALNPLLADPIDISGIVGRDSNGLYARNLALVSPSITLGADGHFGRQTAGLELALTVADLGLFDQDAQGTLNVKAVARGENGVIALAAHGKTQRINFAGHLLDDGVLNFNGILDNSLPYQSAIFGKIRGQGILEGENIALNADFSHQEQGNMLQSLVLAWGGITLSGSLESENGRLIDGILRLETQDPAALLTTFSLPASSEVLEADIVLSHSDDKQNIDVVSQIHHAVFRDIKAQNLDMHFGVLDLWGSPQADVQISAQTILAGQLPLADNARLAFTATSLPRKIPDFPDSEGGWQFFLNEAELHNGAFHLSLVEPAFVTRLEDGHVEMTTLLFEVAGGLIQFKGTMADRLALDVAVENVPLTLVEWLSPQMGAQGQITGKGHMSGKLTAPNFDFSLTLHEANIEFLRKNGIPPLNLTLQGALHGKTQGEEPFQEMEVAVQLNGSGVEAAAQGRFDLSRHMVDLTLNLPKISLSLLQESMGAVGLDGSASARADIRGSLFHPEIDFVLTAHDISSTLLRENGLSPLAAQAKGRIREEVLILDIFEALGPQNLNLTASGRVSLIPQELDLTLAGSAPLALANRLLAERGATASGRGQIEATIKGYFTTPRLDGRFSVQDGHFIDAQTHAGLTNMNIQGNFDGDEVNLTMTAQSASGGNVSASGTISTDITRAMPASLRLQFDHSRYNDGALVLATVSGHIDITGPLLQDFNIGGDILVEKAEITVPSSFGSIEALEIDHKNLNPAIAATLTRAKMETGRSRENKHITLKRSFLPRLDLSIRAPSQIFVRGRGLDAELGGRIHLGGTIDDIRPVGNFNLIRGRFDILTKRLNFEEGRISLSGTLIPELDFTARAQGRDIDVMISLRGRLDDLALTFSSQPELPQDEVLAFLIFNRSLGELSPLQIAQLASAAAELAGLTHSSLMGNLRGITGLDELDITTDSEGHTGVRAGRYIRDNIYLGVEADSQGKTKGTINLDIDQNLKVKGAVGSDSDSGLGLFYEKDY